ncbi:MAG: nicotinate (nicotinamide) nucleotide adenylyltransferase [Cyanobacteria bacterium]|nr:nicotinate (nicotinamide) nucleotide adenylyltransferase [Cyanobacteriota bacterium]
MTTCCFFGTFNPIHLGHLLIAETVLDQFGFEKIAFVPSATPPHRHQDTDLASAQDRLQMVQLATAGNPRFTVWDDEMKREGLSYTIDTLKKRYPELFKNKGLTHGKERHKIPFIIGTDALNQLGSWHQADCLTQNLCFIQIPRFQSNDENPHQSIKTIDWQREIIPIHTETINLEFIGISSTVIRQKRKANQSLRYWVSEPVRQFIESNHLYLS